MSDPNHIMGAPLRYDDIETLEKLKAGLVEMRGFYYYKDQRAWSIYAEMAANCSALIRLLRTELDNPKQ